MGTENQPGQQNEGPDHSSPRQDSSDKGAAQRPGRLLAAVIMTWAGAGFMVLVSLLLFYASGQPEIIQTVLQAIGRSTNPSDVQLMSSVLTGVGVLYILLAPTISALAFFALKGINRARIALIAVGAIWSIIGGVEVLNGSFPTFLSFIYILIAIGLLSSKNVVAWFRREETRAE